MVVIRSVNEIILSLIDHYRIVLPELDTKEGQVARDLFIDAPASQISLLYDELSKISNLQSLRLAIGSDLDKLAQNYGAKRKLSVKSSGVVLFTFNSLPSVVNINKGGLVTASNGSTFAVSNGISVNPSSSNLYKSIAVKFKNDLDFLGITDQYAVEVSVQATTPGTSGNISKYAINKTSIPSVSNVTNTSAFSGGSNQEDDTTFRNRVLAIFGGSNIGTALGYKNTALSDTSVLDAIVIEPGDPLMTRDGTEVSTDNSGNTIVISDGTGGKVDIIVLGTRLSENVDSFIYRDLSNSNDPTNEKNIINLGQISGDESKTISRKRIDNFKNGVLPAQPVQEVFEVSGTSSGSNFKEKQIDNLGRISGNYEIIKDTGAFSGSPFGIDKFHWISDRISLFEEDRIKLSFNGQDNLTFSDVQSISKIQQNISILNENSTVSSSDRSLIQLLHTPSTNVTRVFNVNTGERYIVVNQNPDGTSSINITGRIKISGNTLPSSSDTLQVDYTWITDYDPYSDYDGVFISNNKKTINNIRTVNDSVDWGLSNNIKKETIVFTKNLNGTLFNGISKHPISSISSVNIFSKENSIVSEITDPLSIFYTRKSIELSLLSEQITSIYEINVLNTNIELYNTSQNDGVIINTKVVVGIDIKYNILIILPKDTVAKIGDNVEVKYNYSDVFNSNTSSGNFSINQITIPSSNLDNSINNFTSSVNYISDTQDISLIGISNIPLSRICNSFYNNSLNGFTNNFLSDILIKETQSVQKDILNQFYITINSLTSDVNINNNQIISIIRISDGLELWNSSNQGIIDTSLPNYKIILSGFNFPSIGDNVVVIYETIDVKRSQLFSFENNIISKSFETMQFDYSNNKYYVDFNNLNGIVKNQINVIRINDGKDIWNSNCSIDIDNNKLLFPNNTFVSPGDKLFVLVKKVKNIKQSLSRVSLSVSDQINNSGIITIFGTTISKAQDIIFSASNNGLKINLLEAIKKHLGLSSTTNPSSNIGIARVVSLEKVSTTSNNEILSVISKYDLLFGELKENSFYSNEFNINYNISDYEIVLPKTDNNLSNVPAIGDKLRITFYIYNKNDSENLVFTKNGSQYSNKKFALIDKFYVSSGFNSLSSRFLLSTLNQPFTGSRYKVFYDYLAPKENERIIIRYNYNKLISDVSFLIEDSRPITSDVIVKSANQVLIDATLNVVIKSEFLSSSSIVLQNVKDVIVSSINSNVLGQTIDNSDLIATAQSVDGIDRVRVLFFNKNGETGQALSIIAQKNEYFVANNIVINQESR